MHPFLQGQLAQRGGGDVIRLFSLPSMSANDLFISLLFNSSSDLSYQNEIKLIVYLLFIFMLVLFLVVVFNMSTVTVLQYSSCFETLPQVRGRGYM